jgi:hypothetical protein
LRAFPTHELGVLQGLQPTSSPISYVVILLHKRYIMLAVILLLGDRLVRKQILGDWERRILEAYVKGERLKGYTALLSDIRKMGLRAIIEGCEKDLALLRNLLKVESKQMD